MPVLRRISPFIECTLTTTGCIEEDTVENFGSMSEILSWIEGHSDIRTTHTIEVLEELGDTFSRGFIRDDEALRIVLTQLRRLASGTRGHIKYSIGFAMYLTISQDVYRCRRCELLYIEIAYEMIECEADTTL
jgi:hypothetical protein